MINAFSHLEGSLRWFCKKREMESPDSLPAVQCNIDATGQRSILSIVTLENCPVSSPFPVDRELDASRISGGARAGGRAGPSVALSPCSDPGAFSPHVTVITSSNSRKRGQSPSSQVWDSRPSRVAHPTTSASSNTHLPTTPTPYHLNLAFFGIALHRTDITANYSINSKINDNKNNMQSVKIRIVLDNYIDRKGIKYLIYNISLILCVPQFIKNNYSNVNAIISELKQRNYEVFEMTIDTKNLGAFPQIQENKSQSFKRTVDNVCDSTLFIKCILINQIFGRAPENSIPVMKNAITVQGIVYGNPHSPSFNPHLMYSGEVSHLLLKKSDYNIIDKTRIIIHSVFESETVSRKMLAYLKFEEKNSEGEPKNPVDEKVETDVAESEATAPARSRCDNKCAEGDDGEEEGVRGRVCDRGGDAEDKKGSGEYVTFKNGEFTFKSLLKLVEESTSKIAHLLKSEGSNTANGWSVPKILRLAGGGESSLNAASGWGSPPNANNNNGVGSNWGSNGNGGNQASTGNNIQQQWANASQRPPGSQTDGNTNKVSGVTSAVTGSGSVVSSSGPSGNWGTPGPNPSIPASSQPNNSSQAIPPVQAASSGGNNSPSANGSGAVPVPPNGSGSVVTGTPAPPTTAKAQLEQLNTMREALFSQDGWGGQHVNQDTNWDVPTSPEPGVKLDQQGGPPVWKPNINNGTDLWEANLRNGGQPPPQPVAKTPWGHTPTTNIGGTWGEDDDTSETNNVWTGPPPPQQWGAPPQQPPHWNTAGKKDDWGGWGEPHRPDIHRPDMHARDLRPPAPDHRDMRAMMNMDGRGDMRGDPRGISGRLNGTPDMWGQHHMPHGMQAPNKMMPPNVGNGVNQWGAQGPKDMGMTKSVSGWEEPSPPAARRNMPNFDDGTSLWGQQRGGAVGVAPWKEMSGGMGRGPMQGPPIIPPNRMPGVAPNPMKPDPMWGGHPHRNGAWEDSSGHSGNWDKDTVNWNDGSMNQAGGWVGPKAKPMGAPGGSWDSEIGDWGGPKPPAGSSAKLLPKDMIWNSKQFRSLVDMGYKKDDVELALRNRDMNTDDALDLLSQMRGGGVMDTWRRHEDHPGGPPFDHQQQYPAPPRHQPPSFPPPQQPPNVPFPQPGQGIGSISNISPAIVQKILNQPTSQPPPPFNQQNNQSGGGGQPSTAQLRMLVQQIQMAVSAGYLNHQILNQPLAPQTLVLLNQLLQQIKLLQQLVSQHNAMQNPLSGKNTTVNLHINVQITKAKQQIANLQNQIAAQQAIYVKQQAGGGSGNASSSGGGDSFYKPQDPLAQIPQLQNNFNDLTLNKDPPSAYGSNTGQQSRLNQWKLPSLEKEEGSEFSRAPGTTTKPTASPQLNPLALQPDSTWSTGRSVNDGWPPTDASDLPDGKESWPSNQPPQASTYTDLVPEFEPGKPWKGNQMKSIEDDPAITPGSVVRSPLSLAAIKDTDIFGSGNQGKASPTTPSERSLSSSTWSYPPPASTPSSFNIAKGAGSKSSWGDTPTSASSELWSSSTSMPKSRGQLPSSTSKPGSSWVGGASQTQRSSTYSQQPNWQSTWLLLKNLTAQIDGSTLKTLCVQHGPLQSFHLYLNQGIALARYSSREEASKAQTALNNCVLGNTTIFAESPAETDVNMILQHLGQGAGGSQWRGTGGKGAGGPTSDTWTFNSLWDSQLADQRATPSSLTNFLPPDLLGGESI